MGTDDPRDDPAVRAAWEEWNRNKPEAFWDVAIWERNGNGPLFGSLDVANRFEIWAHAYSAALFVKSDAAVRVSND